jgi:hypothetical protein
MDESMPPKGALYAFYALCVVALVVTLVLVATYI